MANLSFTELQVPSTGNDPNYIVQAGIKATEGSRLGDIKLPDKAATTGFLDDKRVIDVTIGLPPESARDLRITHWITVTFTLEDESKSQASFIAREFIERVVDAVAVVAGTDIEIIHWQIINPVQILRPTTILSEERINIDLSPLLHSNLQERHYRTIRHLRRGLAQTSPEKRFTSLMLALLIISREWKPDISKTTTCPNCNTTVSTHGPGDRDHLLNLAKVLSGWNESQIEKLWKLRNNVTGHGNEHLSPAIGLELLQASFTAVRLIYDALNAALPGINLEGPAQSWRFADLFRLEDSAVRAYQSVIDIEVKQNESGEWTATWPTIEKRTFTDAHPLKAINALQEYIRQNMNRSIYSAETSPPLYRISVNF